jgi:N-acetylglucosamine malate deacetylase 2
MKYLFFFAHPDDETIACAGTIRQLVNNGDEVILVSATDGSGGEVHSAVKEKLAELGSIGKLRRKELKQATQLLGVTKLEILDFADGEITNSQAWGKMTLDFIALIDKHQPDFVVTYDHSGWYFHLDHVAVSIATTTAFHQSTHRPQGLLLSFVRSVGAKWRYAYAERFPLTHLVDVRPVKESKIKAIQAHASQLDSVTLNSTIEKLQNGEKFDEMYQLTFASAEGEKALAYHPVFKKIID